MYGNDMTNDWYWYHVGVTNVGTATRVALLKV